MNFTVVNEAGRIRWRILTLRRFAGVIPLKREQPKPESAGEILKGGDESFLRPFGDVSGVQLKRKPV